jgi:hypothetical protein
MYGRFLISALAIPLAMSCSSELGAADVAVDSVQAQELHTPVAASRTDLRDSPYQRPYGALAPWNVPVAGLPRHPDSNWYSERLWYDAAGRPGDFNLGFDRYTYPVYYLAEATGMYRVRTTWDSNLDGQLIPWNPNWRPAPGNDSQVIILDPERGREWNLYKVEFRGDTVYATNGNLVPGDYRTRTRGYPPSRGVGIPYLAMLVRPQEIAAGRIDHALSLPIRNTSGQYYVAPATKLEHSTGRPGIPEGMRFALDVTEEEIQRWASRFGSASSQTRRSAVIIARALRDYGWFITDTSGGAQFQFEANVSAQREWESLGLGDRRLSDTRRLPRDMLDGLLTRDRIYAVVPSNQYPAHLRP